MYKRTVVTWGRTYETLSPAFADYSFRYARLQVPIGDLVRRLWVLTHATWIRDPGPGQAAAGANPCRLPWSVIHDRGPGQPAAGLNPRRLPCSEIGDGGPGQAATGANPCRLPSSEISDGPGQAAALVRDL